MSRLLIIIAGLMLYTSCTKDTICIKQSTISAQQGFIVQEFIDGTTAILGYVGQEYTALENSCDTTDFVPVDAHKVYGILNPNNEKIIINTIGG